MNDDEDGSEEIGELVLNLTGDGGEHEDSVIVLCQQAVTGLLSLSQCVVWVYPFGNYLTCSIEMLL